MHINKMTKEEFVSRFKSDLAAKNKKHIHDADNYHRAAVGKQRKAKRRMSAQK